jgi:prepilin-type N-terminal cleavage/methylation domain-containing protein
MNHVDKQKGFTIIELMLAMTFVSLLLMAIAMTVIQIGTMYNRGITLKAVDQSGRAISDDIQRTIGISRPLDLGVNSTGGANYSPQFRAGGEVSNPEGGRLCTGTYSYAWNNGRALENPINSYSSGSEQIRFVKVRDNGGLYCADSSRPIDSTAATEILSAGDRELAIQSFTIQQVADDPLLQQALYRITLELGTNDQTALNRTVSINTIDTSCKPPSDVDSQQEYCAVNKFEFTARAGNKGE